MQTNSHAGSIGWKTIASLLAGGTVVVLVVVMTMGSQVSGILSTVGASIGEPYHGGDSGSASGGGTDTGSDGESGSSGDGSGANGSGPGSGGGSGTVSEPGIVLAVPRDDPLVIKTGKISMRVKDVTAAITTATNRIAALGGYASGSKRSGTGDDLYATVTFRVPSAAWDSALNAMRSTGEVLDEETGTEDVTTQVVDLGARIRNLEVTEAALQSIMDKAGVIKDVLSVQDQLTDVRGQIEQLTAEKSHLEEQASFSTLTATFLLPPTTAVVVAQTSGFDPSKEVDAATAKLIRGLQKLARGGIWFGIVWLPILLALVLGSAMAFVVGRWIIRRWGPRPPTDWVQVGGE
ncbi:MAG TPA: DUF4349 domain-containing protein [Candidatus Limnocylindrales bacterium]|nr:DUF4349 domain-containing protein [Candidatus Limnocylindrales bacterium]